MRELLYFDGPNTLEEVTRQRNMLALAIAEAAERAGIYNGEVPISGPHLLMFLDDMVRCVNTDVEYFDDGQAPGNGY